ncbi:helix-turn-helix domain-containing protein, partial [Ralstonia pseudosolanacearum]|uniref:helix-turn-helix domain-containing protein n=1 Tax=Ralstonia pseudosolanacearum TaxID=1310165 RepID=UPI0032216A44
MVDLDDLRMFRALGVSRSLAAAARLLDVTPPALTVRMRRLEAGRSRRRRWSSRPPSGRVHRR